MTTTPSKPTKEESLLPPKVIAGLTMVASGISFDEAAECVGMSGRSLRKWRKHREANEFIELTVREKINIGTNKLVNNFHLYCDELDKAARDPKLKAYAKKDVIQLIHQIIKDNVLDRIQNRELKEIREVLIDKENSNIINVTDYQLVNKKENNKVSVNDFDEVDERLTAGWYVDSGQRKRYLKSISKKK